MGPSALILKKNCGRRMYGLYGIRTILNLCVALSGNHVSAYRTAKTETRGVLLLSLSLSA